MNRPQIIDKMIESFRRMPGIGPKMAERLSYYLLRAPSIEVEDFIGAIKKAKETVKICHSCYNLSEDDPCQICSDETRNPSLLCVVETPQDLLAISQVKNYKGMYFVLGGTLSPIDGVGPDDIRVLELINHLKKCKIEELIIATDMDSKGETTALFLAEHLKPFCGKISRLGYGMPVGGDLEYADEITLLRAIEGRREI